MAIDPTNWRREIKKLGVEVRALRDEISQINATLNSIEELTRLLTVNFMLTNLDKNFLSNVENNVPAEKIEPARKKIPVFGMNGADVNTFVDLGNSRNLPVDFVITDNENYSAESTVFLINNYKVDESIKKLFDNLCRHYKNILIVADDTRNGKDTSAKGVYTKFRNSFKSYSIDWTKIFVLYVDLTMARRGQLRKFPELLDLSNFIDVEKYFKED